MPGEIQAPAGLANRFLLPLQLHRHWILRITPVVEPLAGLLAIPPCQYQPLQQWWRGESPLLEFVMHHMRDVISRVQANKVEQRERSHGISAAQLHRIVNID